MKIKLNRSIPDHILKFGHLTVSNIPNLEPETALQLAEQVLPIIENECPNDDRPRQAIVTVRKDLANRMRDKLNEPSSAVRITPNVDFEVFPCSHPTSAALDAALAVYWVTFFSSAITMYYVAQSIKIKRQKIRFQGTELQIIASDGWISL
jgi:hypothetical protein